MKIVIILSCVVILTSAAGGLSELKDAAQAIQSIQSIVTELKDEIVNVAQAYWYPYNTVISFKEQVVEGGMDYFVKIKVENDKYVHARLNVKTLGNVKKVSAVQTGKSLADPIEYFER